MLDKLMELRDQLVDRLDNLEGCEDNPVYAEEIKEIRKKLADVDLIIQTECF